MRSLEWRRALIVLGFIVLAASGARAAEEPASGTEWWYVLRARANMKIGNYRAAIESYEKAADLNPDNREALKQLGVANEKQGLTTKAIEAYDRYLARFDDDPEIAFKQADIINSLQIVIDGQQAMDFLSGDGEFAKRQMPGLVLLDLNMPRKSGFEVLMWARQHFRVCTDYRLAAGLAELPDPDVVVDTLGLVIINGFECIVTAQKSVSDERR